MFYKINTVCQNPSEIKGFLYHGSPEAPALSIVKETKFPLYLAAVPDKTTAPNLDFFKFSFDAQEIHRLNDGAALVLAPRFNVANMTALQWDVHTANIYMRKSNLIDTKPTGPPIVLYWGIIVNNRKIIGVYYKKSNSGEAFVKYGKEGILELQYAMKDTIVHVTNSYFEEKIFALKLTEANVETQGSMFQNLMKTRCSLDLLAMFEANRPGLTKRHPDKILEYVNGLSFGHTTQFESFDYWYTDFEDVAVRPNSEFMDSDNMKNTEYLIKKLNIMEWMFTKPYQAAYDAAISNDIDLESAIMGNTAIYFSLLFDGIYQNNALSIKYLPVEHAQEDFTCSLESYVYDLHDVLGYVFGAQFKTDGTIAMVATYYRAIYPDLTNVIRKLNKNIVYCGDGVIISTSPLDRSLPILHVVNPQKLYVHRYYGWYGQGANGYYGAGPIANDIFTMKGLIFNSASIPIQENNKNILRHTILVFPIGHPQEKNLITAEELESLKLTGLPVTLHYWKDRNDKITTVREYAANRYSGNIILNL